ncbi:uncharacterized protein BDR25DRAFT_317058 [Lindgomyces ingoldianus]|uniref:Uncharacterized protein n=1 Tax=Lindgomyces ingoldianus TaxID=673940 RepID=A0ACB6QLA0_9PLEO|nr:uncharacterized protein BDR25DRAFT_317058 [Lindgomyces ingoldianus]KAF2467305.1 hypothetical protein BDR25DRAFT_317058 [Lindgomyces ingoldianus]
MTLTDLGESDPHKVPEGGHASFTWGVAASYGVYFTFYTVNDSFPETISLNYAFIGGYSFGVSMSAASPAVYLRKTFGTYISMCTRFALQTGDFIAASSGETFRGPYLT